MTEREDQRKKENHNVGERKGGLREMKEGRKVAEKLGGNKEKNGH